MFKLLLILKSIDDRLNPVLVKEIRQQLRSSSFVITFLAFQLCLMVGALLYLQDREMGGVVWYVLAVWLYVVVPIRGLFSVREEYYYNTLEPMVMTAVKPRGIIYGKWWALLLQNVIVVSSVLPYIIIRYFLGGVDIGEEISLVFVHFLGGSLVLSWMIALSSTRSIIHGVPLCFISFCAFYGGCVAVVMIADLVLYGYDVSPPIVLAPFLIFLPTMLALRVALSAAPYQGRSVFKRLDGRGDPLRYSD